MIFDMIPLWHDKWSISSYVHIHHNTKLISDRLTSKRLFESNTVAWEASCETCSSFSQCELNLSQSCLITFVVAGMVMNITWIRNNQENFKLRDRVCSGRLCPLCLLYSAPQKYRNRSHQRSRIITNRTTFVINHLIWHTSFFCTSYLETKIKLVSPLSYTIRTIHLRITLHIQFPASSQVCELFGRCFDEYAHYCPAGSKRHAHSPVGHAYIWTPIAN